MPCGRSRKKPPQTPRSSRLRRTPRGLAAWTKLPPRANPSCAGNPRRVPKPQTNNSGFCGDFLIPTAQSRFVFLCELLCEAQRVEAGDERLIVVGVTPLRPHAYEI